MIRQFTFGCIITVVLQTVCAALPPLLVREETYLTPTGTYGLAAGDFNGDGWLDVATTNFGTEHNGSKGLTVYYNQHGTGFSGRTDYITGHRTFGITSADFNGDQLSDLAFATYYGENVSVMYAIPGGGFAPRIDYPVVGNPWDVQAGDFNRDGILDLATNHYNISISYGLVGGGFGNKLQINTGTFGYGNLVADDLNNDTYLDLALTTGDGQSVQVLPGLGSSGFATSQQYMVGPSADAIATGDLNSDGLTDLVVTNWSLNRITTLFGQQGGGFADPHYYFVGFIPRALAIADLNGDSHPDLLLTQSENSRAALTVYLGNADGLLTAAQSIALNGNAEVVIAADFNKDGRLDVATSASTVDTNDSSFSVFYQAVPEPTVTSASVIGLFTLVSGRRRSLRGHR